MGDGIIRSPAGTALITGAAFAVVAAGMHAATDFLNPVLVALLIAVLMAPIQQKLMKRGIRRGMVTVIVIGVIVLFCVFLFWVLSTSLMQMGEALPAYQDMLGTQVERLGSLIPGREISPGEFPLSEDSLFRPSVVSVLLGLVTLIAEFFLVLLVTAFLLPEISEEARFRRYADVIVDYFAARGRTAVVVGAGTGLFLAVIGVDFPLLWGLLIFIFCFIPYIGIWIAAVPPLGMAWLAYGTPGAAAVAVAIAASNVLGEKIFSRSRDGKIPGLSPAVTIISLFFWAWVLGIPGMFLAVPITLAIKTLLESSEETCWLARLMETKNS